MNTGLALLLGLALGIILINAIDCVHDVVHRYRNPKRTLTLRYRR